MKSWVELAFNTELTTNQLIYFKIECVKIKYSTINSIRIDEKHLKILQNSQKLNLTTKIKRQLLGSILKIQILQ